jgi:hypothetical protein
MKIYTLNEEGKRQVLDFLRAHLEGHALDNLDSAKAQDSWFTDAENDATEYGGGFEIPARMSTTGNPIPVTFGPECFDAEEIEE